MQGLARYQSRSEQAASMLPADLEIENAMQAPPRAVVS
jgi:hypothetical protein